MKAIVIDPYSERIEYREISREELDEICGGIAAPHWIVPHCLPGNVGYVDLNGLVDSKKQWFICNVHIWGTLVVVGKNDTDVQCSLEEVKKRVKFKWLDSTK